MSNATSSTGSESLRFGFISPRLWLAISILLSVLIVTVMAWLHMQQRETLRLTVGSLDTMRKARIELSKGVLYSRLAGDPSLPFNREQGLQLIQQSVATLTESVSQSSTQHDPKTTAALVQFQQSITAFKQQFAGSITGGNTQQENAFRLAYFDLEQQADQLDSLARASHRIFYSHLDSEFGWVFFFSLTLLLGNFGLVNASLRAQTRVKSELKEKQAELQQAVNAANVGLWNWHISERKFVFSPEWKRQLGYQSSELDSQYSEWKSRVHPDDLAATEQAVQKFMTHCQGTLEREFRMRHKDGSYRWILASASAQLDDDGNPVSLLGTNLDITQRKLVENSLRESELLFRNVFNQLFQLMVILTPEGRILELNELSLRERNAPRAKCIGKLYWEAPGWEGKPNAQAIWQPLIQQAANQTEPILVEQTYPDATGDLRSADCAIQAIRNESGEVQFIIIQASETTHRKRAEAELRKSEERLRQLHRITSDPQMSHQERIQQLLALGIEQFELDQGVLSQLKGRRCHLAHVISKDNSLNAGMSCDRSEVLCDVALLTNDQITLNSVSQSEWKDHPGHTSFGMEAYMGVPVQAGADVFGTLCFFSRQTRKKPFTTSDVEFMRLMAQWISAELTRFEADAELRRSEERLRLALDAGKMGAWCYYPDRQFFETDENSQQLYGFEPGEFQGDGPSVLARLHPDDTDRVLDLVNNAIEHRSYYQTEYRIIHPDQSVHWVESFGRSLYRPDGSLIGFKGVIFEITERKLAEEKLRQSESHFRALFEAKGVANVECDVNTGRFLTVNQKMCELTGYTAEELLEKTFIEVTHPDERASDFEEWQKFVAGDLPSYSKEKRYIRKDGSAIWVGVSVSLVYEGGSQPTRTLGVIQDITERKKAEDLLRESEERFRVLFEKSAVGNVIIEIPTKRFVSCNTTACEMLGYTREELLQLSVTDVNAQFTQEDYKRVGDEVTQFGKAQFETMHRTKNGELQDVLVVASNLQIEGRTYSATSFLDITERKRAEAALRESEERFRKLFEQAAVGNLIFDTENWRVLDCNATASQMLGYTREEMLQLSIQEINPQVKEEHIEKISQNIKDNGYVQFESKRRTKNGELLDVLIVASNIHIEGKRYGTSSFLDITEQKRAEAALQSERQRLEKIAAVSPNVIFSFRVWSLERSEFVYASPAIYDIYGKTPEELVDGTVILDLIHPDDLPRMIAHMRHCMETMEDWHSTWRVSHPEKGEIWVEGNATLVAEEDNSVTWYGTLNNVTARKRAEAALHDSEKLFRNIFNQQFQYIAILAPDGRLREINDLPLLLTRTMREEHLGKFIWDTPVGKMVANSHERWAGRLQRAADSFEVEFSEEIYVRPDGALGYADCAIQAVPNEAGELSYFIVQANDTTRRKRQEQRLAERERLLTAINNTVPNMIFLWNVETDQAEYVNHSVLTTMGYTPEEFIAKSGDEINALFHPADWPALSEAHWHLRNAPEGTSVTTELRCLHKNGEWRDILGRDVIFERDEHGHPLTMLSVADDVTERKQAEMALRESEQRFRQLTESLPQLVWTCQPNGECDYLSPQWIAYTGKPDEHQLGYGWFEQVHVSDRELALAKWNEAVAKGTNLEVEIRLRHHDGAYRWFQTRATAFRDKAGSIIKWFGTHTDIQELRELSEALRIQKEHLQMLADVSHRFAEAGSDYEAVVKTVAEAIGEAAHDYTAVCLIADDGESVQSAGVYHPEPHVQEFIAHVANSEPYALSEAPFDKHIYETGLPAFLPVVDQAVLLETVDQRFKPIVQKINFQSLIVTPMRNEGRVFGLVCVGRTQPHLPAFDERDLNLLQEVSDRAALALRNAQLYQQVQAELAMRQKTEIKLLQEEQRLSALAAAAPGVLYSFRQAPDGTFSLPYSSPGIERFYGISPASLEKNVQVIFDNIHPDDLAAFSESIANSARDLSPWHFEWRVNSPRDGELWLEGRSMPMRESNGGIIWYGVVTDVTERKRQEQELLKRQSVITAINNAAPSMVLLCDLCVGGIVYANERVNSLMGYTEQELYEQRHKGVFGLMHPDDLPAVYKHLETLKHTADGVVLSYEFRFLHKDGRWRNVQARDTVFERDTKGLATKILSVVDDVTESRQQELRLRARQRQQSALAELSQLALSRLDSHALINEAASLVRLTLEVDGCHLQLRDARANKLTPLANLGGNGKEVVVNIQKDGEPFGFLSVQSRTEREFSLDDLNFLQAVANVISMSLERRQSEEQLVHSREELRQLATHLQTVREEERTAIAREIHDELGQQLTAVRLNMRWIEKNFNGDNTKVYGRVTDTLGLVDDTIQVVRQIATSLHPAILDSFGLSAALEWQIQEFEKHSGIKCRIEAMPAKVPVSRTSAIAVFRICQESLTNIARHAGATEVHLKLWVDDENLWLRIHDNGRGIASDAPAKSRSLGLVGMRERALSLGGEFKITGRPGRGTTVKVRVLLEPQKPQPSLS